MLNIEHTVPSPSSLLHIPKFRNAHVHIQNPLSVPPTFIPVVGADCENGKAHISVLIHIDFIGRLCKLWLVIVDVANKNAYVCCVWKKNEDRDTIIKMRLFLFHHFLKRKLSFAVMQIKRQTFLHAFTKNINIYIYIFIHCCLSGAFISAICLHIFTLCYW